MIKVSRPAWEQQAEAEAQDERAWGAAASDAPQLVLALRRHGSREQAWHVRLLGRAVARRLPGLRVSLACVDRDVPSLSDVMASSTAPSVIVPLWLLGTDRVQRTLFTASALSRQSVQIAAPSAPTGSWPTSWPGGCARPVPAWVTPWSWRCRRRPTPTPTGTSCGRRRCCGPAGVARRSRSPTPPGRHGPSTPRCGPCGGRGAAGGRGAVHPDARHGRDVGATAGRAGRRLRRGRAAGHAPPGRRARRAPPPRRDGARPRPHRRRLKPPQNRARQRGRRVGRPGRPTPLRQAGGRRPAARRTRVPPPRRRNGCAARRTRAGRRPWCGGRRARAGAARSG